MIQKILDKIESKRQSENFLWRFLVKSKDILSLVKYTYILRKTVFFENSIYYFFYIVEYPYKKIMRSAIKKYIAKKYTIEFITSSHKPEILKRNLLKSKIFEKYKLIIQENYTNVPKAYNEAHSLADIKIYLHNDVYLPDDFEENLFYSIYKVEKNDKNWGVLGVAGDAGILNTQGKFYGNLNTSGDLLRGGTKFPHLVATLDELILIVKKNFVFDEKLGNHLYGVDICLQAREEGMKSYAINAFLYHASSTWNTGLDRQLPNDFRISRDYIKEKYKHFLPISTTCTIIPKMLLLFTSILSALSNKGSSS